MIKNHSYSFTVRYKVCPWWPCSRSNTIKRCSPREINFIFMQILFIVLLPQHGRCEYALLMVFTLRHRRHAGEHKQKISPKLLLFVPPACRAAMHLLIESLRTGCKPSIGNFKVALACQRRPTLTEPITRFYSMKQLRVLFSA